MKRFKFRKEEYVVYKKADLEDVLNIAVALTSMYEQNKQMLAMGCGDPNFDVGNVTLGEVIDAVDAGKVPLHIVYQILKAQ